MNAVSKYLRKEALRYVTYVYVTVWNRIGIWIGKEQKTKIKEGGGLDEIKWSAIARA